MGGLLNAFLDGNARSICTKNINAQIAGFLNHVSPKTNMVHLKMPPNGKGKTHIYKATNVFGEFQPLESRSGKVQVLERRLDALDASDLFDEVAVRLGAPVVKLMRSIIWT